MKELSEEKRKSIIENNKMISELLAKNEQILKKEGFKLPIENYGFDEKNEREHRIQVPTGYIRKKDYFVRTYNLMEICDDDEAIVSNIAYSLEASDFNNFILNRFGIYGPIQSMMYKQATINIVSIMEVLINSFVKTTQRKCSSCPMNPNCQFKVTRACTSKFFKKQVDIIKNNKILFLDDDDYFQDVKDMYDYRNHIHLMKSHTNELKDSKHSREKYNEAIKMLKMVKKTLVEQINWRSGDANCKLINEANQD